MRKNILVTGGSGFIGSSLIRDLSVTDYIVSSVSRHFQKKKNSYCLDLTNASEVNNFIENFDKIDIIIHCAAIAHGEKVPQNYSVSEFNSLMVRNLISSFKEKQPHWIFLSTISVYGDTYFDSPVIMEQSPLPSDDYGLGKLRDEEELLEACDHLDVLRLMPTYDSTHMDDIKKRVFIPRTSLKLKILPSPSYSLCQVSEVSSSVLRCLDEAPGKRIHQVGDSHPKLQSDLLDKFQGLSVVVPQLLFKYCVTLLPYRFKILRKVRLMLKKLGMNNIYELGVCELREK